MGKFKYLITLIIALLVLGGCNLLLEEAEKGALDEETPDPGQAWMRLIVNCSTDSCDPELPHNLYFYAYEGMHDWSMDQHTADLDYIYFEERDATFPFSKLYKIARNQLQTDFPWPTARYTGGVFYDLNSGDGSAGTNPLGSAVDPQDRNNYIKLDPDKTNELKFDLYQNPRSDETKVDIEVLCELNDCTQNTDKYLRVVLDKDTVEVLDPFPDYYFELPGVPFNNNIQGVVYDTPVDKEDRNKVWEEGPMIGGAFLDMVIPEGQTPADRDVNYIPGQDPYDMKNLYMNEYGKITYVRLRFPNEPSESENFVHLTVDCDPEVIDCNHLTRDGAALKFYMYKGDWEFAQTPDFYKEWRNPVFPLEVYLEKGEDVDGEAVNWPVNEAITGGAYLDMHSSSGFSTIEMLTTDPKDVCNRYLDFRHGPGNIIEINLTLQDGIAPPALGVDGGVDDTLECEGGYEPHGTP
jgi:hypothetical protein